MAKAHYIAQMVRWSFADSGETAIKTKIGGVCNEQWNDFS